MTMAHKNNHSVNLLTCFLLLLVFTAAEIVLYEVWRQTGFVPKLVLVFLIFVFTIPKAAIVMIYFMHLKFEKPLLIMLALAPFVTVAILVLVTLTDSQTLAYRIYTSASDLSTFKIIHHHGDEEEHSSGSHNNAHGVHDESNVDAEKE
ncbi:MAG: hypothetical protein CMJ20_12890 [Phycisphaeraceae bacterium]|nr:hypothetical protein [Phycisphaeraceae bacterium]|tara:strand:+ start:124 stop:567 length:444 start_codon:yes stop_codon:yes gene_type:complete